MPLDIAQRTKENGRWKIHTFCHGGKGHLNSFHRFSHANPIPRIQTWSSDASGGNYAVEITVKEHVEDTPTAILTQLTQCSEK